MTHKLSLPLLLVAMLLTWSLVSPRDPLLQQPPPRRAAGQPVPDSYAHGVIAREFDGNGVLRSQTEADTLRRFAAAGKVELVAPRRSEYDGDDEWFATAERGLLRERTDLLELSGDTRLDYLTGGAELRTEALVIDLTRKTARSLSAVEVTQENGHRMTAEQLVTLLDQRRAVFTGKVRSIYVPDS